MIYEVILCFCPNSIPDEFAPEADARDVVRLLRRDLNSSPTPPPQYARPFSMLLSLRADAAAVRDYAEAFRGLDVADAESARRTENDSMQRRSSSKGSSAKGSQQSRDSRRFVHTDLGLVGERVGAHPVPGSWTWSPSSKSFAVMERVSMAKGHEEMSASSSDAPQPASMEVERGGGAAKDLDARLKTLGASRGSLTARSSPAMSNAPAAAGSSAGIAAGSDSSDRFPARWGSPPLRQTRDVRPLPGGYGTGSTTLCRWVEEKLKEDATPAAPPPPAGAQGSGTIGSGRKLSAKSKPFWETREARESQRASAQPTSTSTSRGPPSPSSSAQPQPSAAATPSGGDRKSFLRADLGLFGERSSSREANEPAAAQDEGPGKRAFVSADLGLLGERSSSREATTFNTTAGKTIAVFGDVQESTNRQTSEERARANLRANRESDRERQKAKVDGAVDQLLHGNQDVALETPETRPVYRRADAMGGPAALSDAVNDYEKSMDGGGGPAATRSAKALGALGGGGDSTVSHSTKALREWRASSGRASEASRRQNGRLSAVPGESDSNLAFP